MPFDTNQLGRLQGSVSSELTARDRTVAELAAHSQAIRQLDAEVERLNVIGDRAGADRQRAERDALAGRRADRLNALRETNDRLRDRIHEFGLALDWCDADPAFPLLLMPVRLETRFSNDGKQLRVRIYPDDIHIDPLDRGVSDKERSAAIEYWTTAWTADAEGMGTAWRTFVEQVGKRRAAWAAKALTPTNLFTRSADAAPAFPDTSVPLRQPASARLLPDAFTVIALQGGDRSEATGAPVSPVVTVGLYADDGTELANVDGLQLHPDAKWTADYDEAVRIGMAATVDLAHAGARVDRLFVFGVRRSLEPRTAAPQALRALLESHRFGRGLAFVPQGAPSNNTESAAAAWQRLEDPRAPDRDIASPSARANASVLASALGIDAAVLDGLDHSDLTEQSQARAMNVAMWGPTWGSFLEKADRVTTHGSSIPADTREEARQLHRDAVRARGPLPALRVGNQPYGVLPVSPIFTQWKPKAGDAFEAKLLPFLRNIGERWERYSAFSPRVGRGALEKTLMDLLGSSPVSTSLRVRPVISDDMAELGNKVAGAATDGLEVEQMIERMVLEDLAVMSITWQRVGSLSANSRPLLLPLADDSDPEFIAGTLAGGSPAVKTVLQALLALAYDQAQREVTANEPKLGDVLAKATVLDAPTRRRFATVASKALTMSAPALHIEAANLLAAGGRSVAPTLSEYQPIASTRTSFVQMAVENTTPSAAAQFAYFGMHQWLLAAAKLAEVSAAMKELHGTSAQERRILLGESLDLASHRADAWLTALVERRRVQLRQAEPTGITVGAYGWVEGIEPTGLRPRDGGYVHAPSLAHAATAGILRSAYLTHNADPGGSGAFAIDLTSERARTARHLMDGVRQGQPLSSLLGYRIEREMHVAGRNPQTPLDRLVYSLRSVAPLVQGRLTDRHQDDVLHSATEAIAAANVVDGIALIERYQGKEKDWTAQKIRETLSQRPANNPYLRGEWQPVSDAEWAALCAIIESAAAACDAVADVLLAESVHQLVSGNVARAAAALDAASSGDASAPQPDVLATPGDAVPFTHSVMIVSASVSAWDAATPRALAAPRLEAWCAQRLGAAAEIVVVRADDGTPVTVHDSGLGALDIIYSAGDRGVFMQQLQSALALRLPAERQVAIASIDTFADAPAGDWPASWRAIGDVYELASSLRGLLVASRPLSALDLALPNASTIRSVAPDALADSARRASDAMTRLAGLADAMEALFDQLDAATDDTQRQALAAQLPGRLQEMTAFGIQLPIMKGDNLSAIAHVALAEARRRVTAAASALEATAEARLTAERVWLAGEELFGDGFWILSVIAAPPEPDAWTGAIAAAEPRGAGPTAVRRLLTDLASVRDNVRRYLEVMLLTEATGHAVPLRVAQMEGPGGAAASAWIGGALDAAQPTPTHPITSAVLDIAGEYGASAGTVGLVIDHWVDAVPVRERRGSADTDPVDERVTSGIAFNAAAPSARAPQALLLAISPDGERWTTDRVLATLEETLKLARMRTVSLEGTKGAARVLPAIYANDWSLQGEKALDLRFAAELVSQHAHLAAFIKE